MSRMPKVVAWVLFAVFVLILWNAHSARADFEAPETITIPAGPFIFGSNRAEREAAYRLDEKAYGHSVTRKNKWYEFEFKRQNRELPAYRISRTLITVAQYAVFVQETGHRLPQVGKKEWKGYRLIHPFSRTRKFAWKTPKGPADRQSHPVVLVSYDDAVAYANWLSRKTGDTWRLPKETEWEKAARGTKGWRFPWGDSFEANRLNSHDNGPFDTVAVGTFPDGDSAFGLKDPAGQVFEWTSTARGNNRHIVKGGSWDDKGCGVCRPAARHSRPDFLKHILVGFRLVRE